MPYCHQPHHAYHEPFSGQYMFYGCEHRPGGNWKACDITTVSWSPRDTLYCYDESGNITEKWAQYACIVYLKNRQFTPFLPLPKDQAEVEARMHDEHLLEVTSVPFIKIGIDRMKRYADI